MTKQKPKATRTATGDWNYRGFTISQCYRTKRWVAIKNTTVFWSQTLRAAKHRIDCEPAACPDAHLCRYGIDN